MLGSRPAAWLRSSHSTASAMTPLSDGGAELLGGTILVPRVSKKSTEGNN